MTITSTDKITKLGLIAGEGDLPVLLAKSALRSGVNLTIFALSKSNIKYFKKLTNQVYQFSIVDIFPMLEKGKALSLRNLCFIGKVPKIEFLKNLYKLDAKLLSLVKGLKDWNDDSLHLKIVDFLEREHNFKIVDQTIFLEDLFPSAQSFCNRKLSEEEMNEAIFGLKMAKGIGNLDIGQTVVVNNKSVIAVEAIEGTNACIKRALKVMSPFQKNKKITVAKASKPNQDRRFDIPTIGLGTIEVLPKGSNLVFEANETFFVDQISAIQLSNKKNISITSIDLGEPS